MDKETLPYIPSIILFTVVSIVLFLANRFGLDSFIHEDIKYSMVFFGASSFLFHIIVNKGLERGREQFIPFYLSSVTLRLVLAMIFLVVFLLIDVENPSLFIINFLVLYLCFTLFEIINLYAKLRRFLRGQQNAS